MRTAPVLLVVALALGMAAPTYAAPVLCFGSPATIVGTAGSDWIVGTPGHDVIHAGGGADVIRAGLGHDVICAGPGADVVRAGWGRDFIIGGAGDDVLSGEGGSDEIEDGYGSDASFGGPGPDFLYAPGPCARPGLRRKGRRPSRDPFRNKGGRALRGPGTDLMGTIHTDMRPITSVSAYFGGPGIDALGLWHAFKPITIDLTLGVVTIDGVTRPAQGFEHAQALGTGDATLIGNDVGNSLRGDVGDDQIEGRGGNDVLFGNRGTDVLDGGDGLDECHGETVLNCES